MPGRDFLAKRVVNGSVKAGNQRYNDSVKVGGGKNKSDTGDSLHTSRARYRCFLPDLAGLAGERRVRPMPDQNYSSILIPLNLPV